MSAKKKKGEIPAYEQRLKEARNHIKTGHYRSAVMSASIGIELLMLDLYDALIEKLRDQGDHAGVSNLEAEYNSCFKNRTADNQSGEFGRWIKFYGRRKDHEGKEIKGLRNQLRREFTYNLDHFHGAQLRKIKDLRNKCSHAQKAQPDYQPSRNEAEFVCNHLALFLEETNRAPAVRQDHEWTKDWHKKWDDRIEKWLKQERNKEHRAQIVSELADQLRLVVDLIDDEDVPRKLKTQLMWAVIYVIEPDDLIPEGSMNVPTLTDDAAVLALTLYWLVKNDIIERETLNAHWHGKGDLIKVTKNLYRRIVKDHTLFNDEQWAVIGAIAEKGPRVLWQMLK